MGVSPESSLIQFGFMRCLCVYVYATVAMFIRLNFILTGLTVVPRTDFQIQIIVTFLHTGLTIISPCTDWINLGTKYVLASLRRVTICLVMIMEAGVQFLIINIFWVSSVCQCQNKRGPIRSSPDGVPMRGGRHYWTFLIFFIQSACSGC